MSGTLVRAMVPCAGIFSALRRRFGNVTRHILLSRASGVTPPPVTRFQRPKVQGRLKESWAWAGLGVTPRRSATFLWSFPGSALYELFAEAVLHNSRFARRMSGSIEVTPRQTDRRAKTGRIGIDGPGRPPPRVKEPACGKDICGGVSRFTTSFPERALLSRRCLPEGARKQGRAGLCGGAGGRAGGCAGGDLV